MKDIWICGTRLKDDQLRWILCHCVDINRLALQNCEIQKIAVEELASEVKKTTQVIFTAATNLEIVVKKMIPPFLFQHNQSRLRGELTEPLGFTHRRRCLRARGECSPPKFSG